MKKWLFNPFETIAGWQSLLIGLPVIILTSVIASVSGTRLDGVIDLHVSNAGSFIVSLTEGLIDWFSLSLFAYISGLLLSRSSIRIIDVFGTQSMARLPFLFACLFSFFFFDNNIIHYFEYRFLKMGTPIEVTATDVILFALGTLTTLLTVIWSIVLMYRAYSVSCNVKGTRGVLSFIGCVIFSEILSKVLISLICPV